MSVLTKTGENIEIQKDTTTGDYYMKVNQKVVIIPKETMAHKLQMQLQVMSESGKINIFEKEQYIIDNLFVKINSAKDSAPAQIRDPASGFLTSTKEKKASK